MSRCMIFLMSLITVMGVIAGVSIYFSLKQYSSHCHASATPAVEVHYDMTVSKTLLGAFTTVADALAMAPTNRAEMFYVHISAGVYEENIVIPSNLTKIFLVGDGARVTKIKMNRHALEFRYSDTGTIKFSFTWIAGCFHHHCSRRMCILQMKILRISGYLIRKIGFRECDIYGTIDITFGEAAEVFQNCNVIALVPILIYFTAQGKNDFWTSSAFVFQNSYFSMALVLEQEIPQFVAYLGRPWFHHSIVVMMESYLGAIISPLGWAEWPGHPTDKLTYLEYKNKGPGVDTSQRVN